MSLGRMDKPSDRVRFLDDIDLTLTMDDRSSDSQKTMNVDVTIQPIVFRASYRDINLIMTIVNKALEFSARSETAKNEDKKRRASNSRLESRSAVKDASTKQVSRRSARSRPNRSSRASVSTRPQVLMSREHVRSILAIYQWTHRPYS